MDCTDEVWVAGVEEAAIALWEFGHGGRVEVLGLGLVFQKLRCWWRSWNHDCSLRDFTTNPL